MSQPNEMVNRKLLENALTWFQGDFRQQLVSPIESHFPNYSLPRDIQAVLQTTTELSREIQGWPVGSKSMVEITNIFAKGEPKRGLLLKQAILRYRRVRATRTETHTEKTFHQELTETVEQELRELDALVAGEWFQQIEMQPLPRLKDFLPIQFIEAAAVSQIAQLPRQHDEKFHVLQAPNLFLPDLAYFRTKCEDRGTSLAIAFLDIDHFRQFNTDHTETKVDRNLLPRFMQTVEAHVFHHGYAYRQGGDEYLILIPSLSKALSIHFLDELRLKLASLEYPDIKGKTTVSIGLCVLEPDCPLTDRELRDRASQAKQFAKKDGRNRIAAYRGPRFVPEDIEVVSPQPS